MIEYVIPVALIGMVIGLGVFYIMSDGKLFDNFMATTGGSRDLSGGKVAFGTGSSTTGVFVDPEGILRLSNSNGQSIILPVDYYEKYKDDVNSYLNSGKFDVNSSMAVETTGAAGIEDISNAGTAATHIYSSLLEIATNNSTDPETKTLLGQMTTYGKGLADIEYKLIDIKKHIEGQKEIFEAQQMRYLKTKDAFYGIKQKIADYKAKNPASALSDSIDPELLKLEKQLLIAYNTLEGSYDVYHEAAETFLQTSESYLGTANSYFDDLKNSTGASFDSILEQIKDSDQITQTTKDMVVPIGTKIQDVKDSVNVYQQDLQYYVASFNSSIKGVSDVLENAQELKINIDETAGDETLKETAKVEDNNNNKGNKGGP
jgi:hypothetical protein